MSSENTANSASPIIFYCKDCGKVVDTERVGKKYVYKCKICGTKNVAFGTDKSIKSFFRIPEEKETSEVKIPVEGKKDDVKENEGTTAQ